jgi:DNA-binding PadR family transcriptional regulator
MELIGDTKKQILLEIEKKPTYGYRLAETLTLPLSTIYGHLKDLKELELITKYEEDRQKIYTLTEKGKQFVKILK